MPRIPRYQQQSQASSFVGAPVPTKESSIFSAIGSGSDRLLKVVQEQAKATAKQEAATAYYRYQQNYNRNLSGTEQERGLADENAGTPLKLPDAAVEMGEGLAGEMAQSLGTEDARAEFNNTVRTFLIGEHRRLSLRAIEQNQANQVVAMENGGAILADTAGNVDGVDGATQIIQGIYDNYFTVDESRANISEASRQKGFKDSVNRAKRNFISGQLERNPIEFASSLNKGEYSTIEVGGRKTPFISAKEAKILISDAETIAKNRKKQAEFDFAISNGELGLELVKRDLEGGLTIQEVDNLEFEAEQNGYPAIAKMYGSYRTAMMSGNDSDRVTDFAWYSGVFDRIEEISKEAEPKGFFSKKVKIPQKQLNDAFEIIRETNEKYANNELTKKDRASIIENIYAGVIAPLGGTDVSGEAPYFTGLRAIKEAVKATNSSAQQQNKILYDTLSDYDRELAIFREAGVETPEQAVAASQKAVKAMRNRLNPGINNLAVGSTVETPFGARKVTGMDPLGNPIFVELSTEDLERLK